MNEAGAFIINQNKNHLDADVAILCRYRTTKTVKRTRDSNSCQRFDDQGDSSIPKREKDVDWAPAGWHQQLNLAGEYTHAVDRGSSFGHYALIKQLRSGFDA